MEDVLDLYAEVPDLKHPVVCFDESRRIDDRKILEAEIAAWEAQRNTAGARIKWMFTTPRART